MEKRGPIPSEEEDEEEEERKEALHRMMATLFDFLLMMEK